MAQAVHETTYDVDAKQLLSAVMDYEKYPEFVDGMKKVIVERNGSQVTAHYELSMMGKDMSYSLTLKEEPEAGHLSWTLLKSEFFKINNGDWQIESLGEGKCKARYFSEVDFNFPVPGFVLKPMVKSAVPKMMDGFYIRAKKLPTPVRTPIPEPVVVAAEATQAVVPESVAPEKVAPETVPSDQQRIDAINASLEAEQRKNEKIMNSTDNYKNDGFKNDGFKNSDMHDSGVLSWAKKLMTVGVGTFFLTEEALRGLVTEFKFPKEIMGTVLEGAKSVRKEFMQNVVNEMMAKVSDKMNPADVVAEFLKKNEVTFEIKLKVKDKSDTEV